MNPSSLTISELPFNRLVGLQPAAEDGALLCLPAGPQYLNHLGTVHASALLALAEASSGEFLLRQFGAEPGLLPVVRRLDSKFRKPAQGSVTSRASVAPEAVSQCVAQLGARGRASITVDVELHDQSGAHVLTAAVEWFIQRLAGGAASPSPDSRV